MTCTASFTQNAFRGRNDDNSETLATWKANQDVNWNQACDVNFRVRFQIQEGAACAKNNVVWRLQYNLAGAGWVDASASSNVIRASASTQFTDGAATTDQLTGGTGTFQGGSASTGGMDEGDCNAGGASMDIAASGHSECEFCVQLRSADVIGGQTIQLRVTDSGNALASYTSTPTITAAKDQSVSSGLGALVLTGQQPTITRTQNRWITPGLGQWTLAGYAPNLGVSVMRSTGLGELSLTCYAPSVSKTANIVIGAGLGALSVTGYAPSRGKTESAYPGLGELTITGFAPAISATDLKTATPNVAALALTGYAPTVTTAGITLRVSWVELDVLSAPMSVSTGLGQLSLTAYAPVVQLTVTTTEQPADGRGNWKQFPKKPRKIRYSDYERREDYAEALAMALAESSIPIRTLEDDEDELDDEALIQALTLTVLHWEHRATS